MRRKITGAVAAFALVAAFSTVAAGDGLIDAASADAGTESRIDARSPGERIKGELRKIKRDREQEILSQAAAGPVGGGEDAPPVLPPAPLALPAQVTVPEFVPIDTAVLGPVAPEGLSPLPGPALVGGVVPPVLAGLAPGLPGVAPPGGGGLVPPGGTEGPLPGGGTPPDVGTNPVTVPPAVPEPGTWLTLMIGFWACGLMIRRKRPKVEPVVGSPHCP